jgi:hypothetical protein
MANSCNICGSDASFKIKGKEKFLCVCCIMDIKDDEIKEMEFEDLSKLNIPITSPGHIVKQEIVNNEMEINEEEILKEMGLK